MLERLARAGRLFVATQSSSPRALPAHELADRARRYVSRRRDDPGSRRRTAAGPRAWPARARDRLALSPRRPPRGGAVSVSVPGPAPRPARRQRRRRTALGCRRRHPLRVRRARGLRGRGVCNGVPHRQTADMSALPLADFFDSQGWFVTRNLLFFFVVVFWLAVGYWTYKDARRRIQDPWLVAMATLLGLVPPFVGALIYMLFRPPEYLEEVRERELEMKALQALRPSEERCPVCRSAVETGLPRVPRLHDAAPRVVLGLQGAARPAVAGVPVLRDARLAPGAGRAAGAGVRSRRAGEGAASSSRLRVDFRLDGRADAHPRQARRDGTRACRRDPRALRAARSHGACRQAALRRPRAGRAPLRRACREAVLRGARRLHHDRLDAGARARGRGRGEASHARRSAPRTPSTPPPARSAATSRSRCRTTSCTARTRPRPRSARSSSGSAMTLV